MSAPEQKYDLALQCWDLWRVDVIPPDVVLNRAPEAVYQRKGEVRLEKYLLTDLELYDYATGHYALVRGYSEVLGIIVDLHVEVNGSNGRYVPGYWVITSNEKFDIVQGHPDCRPVAWET